MTEKHPAVGKRGMVITNHPLASAAGAEMLAAGGNAIDAAIAAFFTLTVVEPMMVGILGGGMAHIRLADGSHTIIDNQSTAPGKTGPSTFTPDPAATRPLPTAPARPRPPSPCGAPWYPPAGGGRSIIGWSQCGRQAACVEFSAEVSAVSMASTACWATWRSRWP